MEQYIIKGGNPLVGEVEIGGAKNAALAIIAAAIMTDETVEIDNLPDVKDVKMCIRDRPNHLARALYIPTDSRNPKVRRSQLPENHPDSVLCISQHLPAALHQVTCFLRLP